MNNTAPCVMSCIRKYNLSAHFLGHIEEEENEFAENVKVNLQSKMITCVFGILSKRNPSHHGIGLYTAQNAKLAKREAFKAMLEDFDRSKDLGAFYDPWNKNDLEERISKAIEMEQEI